jgi:uncharacterized protein (TIGR01777 family)
MRILVAGSSGFLGRPLVEHLRAREHDVVRLVRREASAEDESTWDPYAGELDRGLVRTADVVVNLAGASNKGNPHSRRWGEALLHSRVTTTKVLAEAVAEAGSPPTYVVGVGTSAYGDQGAAVVTEESPDRGGDALLARVVRAWEEAARPALEAGGRVALMRTAPIVHPGNVPTQQLIPLFQCYLGGRVGRGGQYFPVVSLEDWKSAATFLAENDVPSGPYNVCCPTTPTHREFVEALAQQLHRPAPFVVPSKLLEIAMGQLSPELTNSTNLRPAALLREGFVFHDDDVADVVATALAARRRP